MANEKEKNEENPEETDETYLRSWRMSAAFRRASFHAPDEVWNLFAEADNCEDIVDYFRALIKGLNIDPSLHGIEFYEVLKSKLTTWKCQSLWDLLNARLKHSEYKQGKVGKGTRCIIIGAGPIGLRMAIESLMLGCKTVVVEKRRVFSRNNVLHLWPFLLTDFRSLGAKKFYGKFGSGLIEHINIRTLQCVLLKVALLLGLEIHLGVSFKHLVEPVDEQTGWRAAFEPENHEVSKFEFDAVIGADGKKNVLPGFPQIELRGALAIGITCNFVNNNSIEEAGIPEISGISYQFNPTFFNDMDAAYGVKLENIVYYKDETHYFVMTALKSSLLNLGVIKEDKTDPKILLSQNNLDKDKLIEFTKYAVNHATNHMLPTDIEFKKLSNGDPDIALFDFTSIKKAANASRIIERKKHKLMLALIGDSLIEPFWPTGSGCGRGVLSALDVAWMLRQFALKIPPLMILRERENIFKLLSGTTNESLQKNYKGFTIDPKTRYSGFDAKKVTNVSSLKGLYDTDDAENADFTVASPTNEGLKKRAARRRSSSGGSARKTSTHVHLHGQLSKPKRKSDRATLKDQAVVGNTKQFWEEHNKKNFEEQSKGHVPKPKKSATSVEGDESGIEELSEFEDDVIAKETAPKKGFRPSRTLKQQASKDDSRLLKRQISKDDMSSPRRKGVFHSKGGGLKSKSMKETQKKSPEKTEGKSRKKSVPDKKSTTQLSKHQINKALKEEPMKKKEPPRYDASFSESRNSFNRSSCNNSYNNSNASYQSLKKLTTIKEPVRQSNGTYQVSKSLPKRSSVLTRSRVERNTSIRARTGNKMQKPERRISIKKSGSSSKLRRKSMVKTRSKSKLMENNGQRRMSSEQASSNLLQQSMSCSQSKRPRLVSNFDDDESKNVNKSDKPLLPAMSIDLCASGLATSKLNEDTLNLPSLNRSLTRGTRLCPLGNRNRLAVPGLIGKFKFQSSLEEKENSDAPRKLRKQRTSNAKLVRLNSIKKKRKSMLPIHKR